MPAPATPREIDLRDPAQRAGFVTHVAERRDLAALPDGWGEALLVCLTDPRIEVQRLASDQLVRFAGAGGAPFVHGLRGMLAGGDRAERWAAAYTLARLAIDEPWPADELVARLDDPSSDVRWAAATGLVLLVGRFPHVVPRLVERARHAGPAERRMVLFCLRDLDVEPAVAVELVSLGLEDGDAAVRLAALAWIGRSRQPPAGAALAAAVAALVERDADPGVRRAAAAVLPRIRGAGRDAEEVLERVSADPDRALARAARAALERLRAASAG